MRLGIADECLRQSSTNLCCVCTAVVAQGNTVVFQHRVEALLDGQQVYTRVEVVEVSRTNSDTLLVLATYDDRDDLAMVRHPNLVVLCLVNTVHVHVHFKRKQEALLIHFYIILI